MNDHLVLELEAMEVVSFIQAQAERIRLILGWTIRPTPEFKENNWFDVQMALDDAMNGYAKAVMTLREFQSANRTRYTFERLSSEEVEILNRVTLATGWPSAPSHLGHKIDDCSVCSRLVG